MRRVGLVAVLVALAAGDARAQPAAAIAQPARKPQAVSVGLWSLQGFAGLQGQYERQFRARWSWIAGGGFRFAAREDYGSSMLAAGGEARWWIKGRAVWAHAAPRSMLGWFLGGRLDLAWTRTTDHVLDRTIGQNLGIAITGTFGYRFLIRDRVELTPMIGAGITQEIDLEGRLPTYTRPTGRLGLTLGWMF